MGQDKRGLTVDGLPMVRRVSELLAAVSDELIVVEHPDRPVDPAWLAGMEVCLARDRRPAGPLAGMEAGMRAMTGSWALVAAADMPLMRPDVLRLLIGIARRALLEQDAVLLEGPGGGPASLPAIYRRRVLARISERLDASELRLQDLLASLSLGVVALARWSAVDPAHDSLVNVNTPSDVHRLGRSSADDGSR